MPEAGKISVRQDLQGREGTAEGEVGGAKPGEAGEGQGREP